MNFANYSFDITHPRKILFHVSGISKSDVLNYYMSVAGFFIYHSRMRPVSMQRFPQGIQEKGFFQKNAGDYFPDWIPRVEVPKEDGSLKMVMINNKATLAYLCNQDVITHHLWLSRADRLKYPDQLIFDLDPPQGNFELVREAALALHEMLSELGLIAFVKTTGSRGLHVLVPLRRQYHFDQTRNLARQIAEVLAARFPSRFTTAIRKEDRRGRLFLDYLRNGYAQTAVAPYSLRAIEGAPVAMPVTWAEIRDPALHARKYTIKNSVEKLKREGDAWKGLKRWARSPKIAMKVFGID